MDIQANISNNIKKYRKEANASQEALAERLGVTSQAVSKWECMQSIPDIEVMIEMCELFGISLDKLILNKDPEVIYERVEVPCGEQRIAHTFSALPDDSDVRVLQFKGQTLLIEDRLADTDTIKIQIPKAAFGRYTNVHVIGNVEIDGDVSGDLACGNISGNLSCGGDIACTAVEKIIECDGDIACTNVNEIGSCGGDIACQNIQSVNECCGDITCTGIGKVGHCEGDISCNEIGSVGSCDGDIDCDRIGTVG